MKDEILCISTATNWKLRQNRITDTVVKSKKQLTVKHQHLNPLLGSNICYSFN